jgi:hypothetical protein
MIVVPLVDFEIRGRWTLEPQILIHLLSSSVFPAVTMWISISLFLRVSEDMCEERKCFGMVFLLMRRDGQRTAASFAILYTCRV